MRSRLSTTTVLTGVASAIWSETSRFISRLNVKRRPSLRCWILGHEDWVRRAPGRLYLNVLTVDVRHRDGTRPEANPQLQPLAPARRPSAVIWFAHTLAHTYETV